MLRKNANASADFSEDLGSGLHYCNSVKSKFFNNVENNDLLILKCEPHSCSSLLVGIKDTNNLPNGAAFVIPCRCSNFFLNGFRFLFCSSCICWSGDVRVIFIVGGYAQSLY